LYQCRKWRQYEDLANTVFKDVKEYMREHETINEKDIYSKFVRDKTDEMTF